MTPSPLTTVATIPVPTGWRYVWEDMPSIERDVGNHTLIVALEDGTWHWWLCPKGTATSVARGDAWDMLDAVWRVFDALARRLDSNGGGA